MYFKIKRYNRGNEDCDAGTDLELIYPLKENNRPVFEGKPCRECKRPLFHDASWEVKNGIYYNFVRF